MRILFDNMSSAVVHIEDHGKRKLTEMFTRFMMHSNLRANSCSRRSSATLTVRTKHEQVREGNVENKVGYIRRNYLLPPPEIKDLEVYNANLLMQCMEDLKREHYVKGEMISELFASEQEELLPLPTERFRVFTIEKAKTDKYSFIQYENNRYSTSPEYARCEMWVEIGAYELRILNGRYEHIVTHEPAELRSAYMDGRVRRRLILRIT